MTAEGAGARSAGARPRPERTFGADGRRFRLAAEAERIRLAHLFDPYLAVHASHIEPLPHQITAVYGKMLPRQPLRFLLADDPGAGKTIMAGLLIRELMLRGDLERCLVVAPGSLVEQWQDELESKFGLAFDLLTRERVEAAVVDGGNPFAGSSRLIARLDVLSRSEDLRRRREAVKEWDLVVCDELAPDDGEDAGRIMQAPGRAGQDATRAEPDPGRTGRGAVRTGNDAIRIGRDAARTGWEADRTGWEADRTGPPGPPSRDDRYTAPAAGSTSPSTFIPASVAPAAAPADPDDLEDAAQEDVDAIEARVLGHVTTAETVAEFEAEVDALRRLEDRAWALRRGGADTKWLELASLPDHPLMTGPDRRRSASLPATPCSTRPSISSSNATAACSRKARCWWTRATRLATARRSGRCSISRSQCGTDGRVGPAIRGSSPGSSGSWRWRSMPIRTPTSMPKPASTPTPMLALDTPAPNRAPEPSGTPVPPPISTTARSRTPSAPRSPHGSKRPGRVGRAEFRAKPDFDAVSVTYNLRELLARAEAPR